MRIVNVEKTQEGYTCQMDDKSFWTCNVDGKEWKSTALGIEELQKSFESEFPQG